MNEVEEATDHVEEVPQEALNESVHTVDELFDLLKRIEDKVDTIPSRVESIAKVPEKVVEEVTPTEPYKLEIPAEEPREPEAEHKEKKKIRKYGRYR